MIQTKMKPLVAFALASEKRKKIVQALLAYPERQWSVPTLEDQTKLPHATVFRTIKSLQSYGLLKSIKVNRRDMVYEFVKDSPYAEELKNVMDSERKVAQIIAGRFIREIEKANVNSIILYGSSVKGAATPESDIDILVITNKHDEQKEREMQDKAAELSSKMNKTISVTMMDIKKIKKDKETPFLKSIKENMEVLYGKPPF